MRKLTLLSLVAALLCVAPAIRADDEVFWSYEDNAFGPNNWSNLSLDYGLCQAGEQQSPIDLDNSVETYLEPVELHWKKADWELLNNGRTIAATTEDGGYAIIAGKRFELSQIHFRNPSEHHIEGKAFPMELQFLHRSGDGGLAVVAVMVRGGGTNPIFDGFMAKAPVKEGSKSAVESFDPTPLSSDPTDQFRYQGSLTTPPCTQNVLWTVLTDPIVVSDAALLAFNSLFKNNARPLQPVNRRYVLTD